MAAASTTSTAVAVSKDAVRRILSDVRELMSCPLHDNGIYYRHDEEDMLFGYAMLYGQPGTLYEGGYYFFRIKFPVDYPHSPITATFLTNDGVTRMHPNYYKTGFVCISIINNWKGEQWTGCLTLKSVLLTMISIMDDKPLLHEPGIRESHIDFLPYTRIIEFKTIDFATCCILNEVDFARYISMPAAMRGYFYPIMLQLFETSHARIAERARALKDKHAPTGGGGSGCGGGGVNPVVVALYGMSIVLNYDLLVDRVSLTIDHRIKK